MKEQSSTSTEKGRVVLKEKGSKNNWQGVILSGSLKMPCFNSASHQGQAVVLSSGPNCPECGQRLSWTVLPQVI